MASMLGHKCDLAVMALHPDWSVLRGLQSAVQAAGLEVVDSYVSITEVSEYAKGMPEHMLDERLYPSLPPEGKPVFCFYPMTKRREAHGELVRHAVRRAQRDDARARRERADVRRPASCS